MRRCRPRAQGLRFPATSSLRSVTGRPSRSCARCREVLPGSLALPSPDIRPTPRVSRLSARETRVRNPRTVSDADPATAHRSERGRPEARSASEFGDRGQVPLPSESHDGFLPRGRGILPQATGLECIGEREEGVRLVEHEVARRRRARDPVSRRSRRRQPIRGAAGLASSSGRVGPGSGRSRTAGDTSNASASRRNSCTRSCAPTAAHNSLSSVETHQRSPSAIRMSRRLAEPPLGTLGVPDPDLDVRDHDRVGGSEPAEPVAIDDLTPSPLAARGSRRRSPAARDPIAIRAWPALPEIGSSNGNSCVSASAANRSNGKRSDDGGTDDVGGCLGRFSEATRREPMVESADGPFMRLRDATTRELQVLDRDRRLGEPHLVIGVRARRPRFRLGDGDVDLRTPSASGTRGSTATGWSRAAHRAPTRLRGSARRPPRAGSPVSSERPVSVRATPRLGARRVVADRARAGGPPRGRGGRGS